MMRYKISNLFRREVISEKESTKKSSSGGDYKQNVVYVTSAEAAMKIAAVYRAVNLISSSVASLTLQYKRKDRAKDYFKLYNDGDGRLINYVLSVRPNERMNSFVMVKNAVSMILLQGNAYIYPRKNRYGGVEKMYLCTPGSVAYDMYKNVYVINDVVNQIFETVEADDIIHLKNVSRDGGYTGVSTITYAATTLGIAATADNETLKRFATGGRFKAILQNNTSIIGVGAYQDKQMEGLSEDLQEALNRGDDILNLKGDGTLTPISMSSADMQFLENKKFTLREIARFFNVPPSKLMDDSNANYKSVEVSNIAFYTEALQPIVTEIEKEFTAKLLSVDTYQDYKFKFDLSSLYALDLDSKAKWDKARLDNGQASVNDLRRESDKMPVDKGDDVYLSVNLAPLGSEKLSGETSENSNEKSIDNAKEP
ncbi:phage portal protein [Bacteroides thetaiotaomicron]|uniref:phage portal protein n=1 Tax=Bacteroides thetaiotaomicron TaxID=818 RepID=UPI002061C732|nr:phage portal protein [Bacteroides thetaiotaomicron]MCS2294603.1 phage portal protein [Bacteroides thetaiotaomicron]DAH70579.1 MAG TPA: portal protein [Caudoviricetes sp.]